MMTEKILGQMMSPKVVRLVQSFQTILVWEAKPYRFPQTGMVVGKSNPGKKKFGCAHSASMISC